MEETTGWGKWAQAGVPHRGWTCVGIEDLGEPSATCQMCERMTIRYVHYMEHPDYDTLLCGCVCAGHMEEDLQRARHRESILKLNLARRDRWLGRRGWRRTRNGNWMIVTDAFRITIFRKGDGWSGVIVHPPTQRTVFARRTYPTCDAARLAAFDGMIFLQTRS